MAKGLGRRLGKILDDVEYSYKEIEIDNKNLSKNNYEYNLELDNVVKLLKEKYDLNVINEDNNLIINVSSKKNLKKLKNIFNI